ncbi:hypothetical protein [Nonomuraea phyllanthi]|uniref:hypothetical protein n=1 Tax=Nonomuraea phyllanthi TaxID=2219224 RepID=UPI001D02A06A|nr:hypothetical protein [Nonomuraea phyllanthi]
MHQADAVRGGWAGGLLAVLQEAIHTANHAIRAGAERLDVAVIARFRARYLELTTEGIKLNPCHPGRDKPRARVLAERLPG